MSLIPSQVILHIFQRNVLAELCPLIPPVSCGCESPRRFPLVGSSCSCSFLPKGCQDLVQCKAWSYHSVGIYIYISTIITLWTLWETLKFMLRKLSLEFDWDVLSFFDVVVHFTVTNAFCEAAIIPFDIHPLPFQHSFPGWLRHYMLIFIPKQKQSSKACVCVFPVP